MGFKGITWVGDIYQQFEDMCLEAEEVICEDTVKYVESQVHTVGASVKKLYSDVMQDLLLPCYVDPLEVASQQLPVTTDMGVYKKPKASTKEDHVWVKDDKQLDKKLETSMFSGPNVDHISYSDEHYSKDHLPSPSSEDSIGGGRLILRRKPKRSSHLSATSVNLGLKDFSKASLSSEIGHNHEALHEQIFMTSRPDLCDEKDADTSGGEGVDINKVGLLDSPEIASCDHFTSNTTLSAEPSVNKATEVRNIHSSCEPGLRTGNDGLLAAELCSNIDAQQNESSTETGSSHSGIAGDRGTNMVEENRFVDAVDQFGDTKLEETCVLVDGDHLVSGKEHAPSSSYKKKIQKAFSWKRSARKQEYKQLAAQHVNIETAADNKVAIPVENEESKSLPSHGSCESEWELL